MLCDQHLRLSAIHLVLLFCSRTLRTFLLPRSSGIRPLLLPRSTGTSLRLSLRSSGRFDGFPPTFSTDLGELLACCAIAARLGLDGLHRIFSHGSLVGQSLFRGDVVERFNVLEREELHLVFWKLIRCMSLGVATNTMKHRARFGRAPLNGVQQLVRVQR